VSEQSSAHNCDGMNVSEQIIN